MVRPSQIQNLLSTYSNILGAYITLAIIICTLLLIKALTPSVAGNIVLYGLLTIVEYAVIILGVFLFPALVFFLYFKSR